MEEQPHDTPEEQTQDRPEQMQAPATTQKRNSGAVIAVLAVALIAALAAIAFLLVIYVFGNTPDPGDGGVALPPPGVTVEATLVPPTPEPGDPNARVIARAGVNVRTGPGLEFPVIGIAPFGSTLEVLGVSRDRTWWVVNVPAAPQGNGWVSDEYVAVENGNNVLVIPSPPTPTPAATATLTPTPAPDIAFSANRTTINAGERATLSWAVESVSAVYVYPIGDRFEKYPVTGEGSREVQPFITTSYELLTFNRDGSNSRARVEITVVIGLTTGRWTLRNYSTSGGGQTTTLPGTELTARFGADGSLSGSGGCNSYNGTFTAFEQTLRVNTVNSSQALCENPAGVMEQEGIFLSLLQQAASMRISAGQLILFDSSGNRLMEFASG